MASPVRWVVGGGVLLFTAVACSLAVDLDSLKASSATSCGASEICRGAVPQGWQGPVTLVNGEESVGCAAPFGSKVIGTVLDALDGGAATCTCSCAALPASCLYRVNFYATADCMGNPPDASTIGNTCAPNLVPNFSFKWLDGSAGPEAGCTATTTPSKPPPTSTAKHLCLGAFPQNGCANGLCMPASATACIAREGELSCPAPFTQRTVVYKNIDDQRTCAGCGCTFDPNSCKSPLVFRMTSGTCASDGGTLATYSSVAGCTSGVGEAGTSARGEIPNACIVTTQGTPSGTVKGADPVTVCCQP